MEYLLSSQNIRLLESFSLVHTVFGFDFDGTLAPICNNPDLVRMDHECHSLLSQLNDTGPVAIISGRSVDDIKKHIQFTPKYIIGNHGIEGIQGPEDLETICRITRDYKRMILDLYQEHFSDLGIELEDKTFSLSLHYRNSPRSAYAESFLLSQLGYLSEARVSKGKMVINIVPHIGLTKGQAFVRLLACENAKFGIYIGDDVTDEDVFIYKNSKLLTIRIGHSTESSASYYLETQDEIIQVLRVLCHRGKSG